MSTDPSSVPSPFDTFAITDVDMLSIPDLHSFRLGDPDEAAELTTETHNATADSDTSPTTETDAAPDELHVMTSSDTVDVDEMVSDEQTIVDDVVDHDSCESIIEIIETDNDTPVAIEAVVAETDITAECDDAFESAVTESAAPESVDVEVPCENVVVLQETVQESLTDVRPVSRDSVSREKDLQESRKPDSGRARGTADSADAASSDGLTFADLPLSPEVLQAVQMSGYETPSEIQAQIIPMMVEGRDVLAQSQTGTGKTAAFALPILTRLDPEQREPQVLVLAPTRELAIQVARSFKTYARCLPDFHVTAIYGGSDYEPQLRALKRGVQVVVGTPGRVIDHIKRGTLDLSSIRCLVLDEADEMLNMGFLDDVRFVLENAPEDRQIALFSATLPEPIREIAEEYLNNPSRISIRRKTMTAESIRQRAVFVAPRDKMDALRRFLELEETDGVIVFTRTREATAEVAEQLVREGFSAVALNGDMAQKVRERTIEQLKSGQLDILVATDVAARGLDVSRVSHVFNYDLPQDSESYIHRVGRTGRAGRAGQAIIFLTNGQRGKLKAIERMTRQTIEIVQVPDADEINTARVRRFRQRIADTVAQQDISMFRKLIHQFAEESGLAMEQIAAALAQISQRGMPFFLEDRGRSFKQDRKQRDRDRSERDNFSSDRPRRERRDRFEDSGRQARGDRDGADRRPRERTVGPVEPGMDRYRIEVGRRDGVKPGNIVGAIANEAGLDGEDIGPIRILDNFSTVDLPEGMPPEVFETLQDTWVSGRQLRLSLMGEDADSGRPRRPQGRRPEQRGRAPRGGGQKSFSDRPRKRFDRDQKNRSDRPRRTPRSRQS